MLVALTIKILIDLIMKNYDFDEIINGLSINSKPMIQTILYKLLPIWFASKIALEVNQSQLNSNMSKLIIHFLVVLLIIKMMNVMINKTSQVFIDDIEYMFKKRINKITVNDYNKVKFIEIIDHITHKSYKNEYTIDTYKLKLFKLVTFTITDYSLRSSVQKGFILEMQPVISPFKFIKFS